MAKTERDNDVCVKQKLKHTAAFALLTGATFFLGVWFMFPDASLERRINAELGRQLPVPVTIKELRREFPLTLMSAHVQVELPQFQIDISSLKIKPAWSRLLRFQPGITAQGKMFNGSFTILHTSAGTTEVKAGKMNLSSVIPGFSAIKLEALLDSAFVNTTSDATEIQTGVLNLKEVKITGLQKLGLGADEIIIGDLTLDAHAENQRLQLKLVNPQGDFNISASGFISPPQLTSRTRLNLELRIGNIPPAYAQLEELLSLTGVRKNADGYLLRLGGRLNSPYLR